MDADAAMRRLAAYTRACHAANAAARLPGAAAPVSGLAPSQLRALYSPMQAADLLGPLGAFDLG